MKLCISLLICLTFACAELNAQTSTITSNRNVIEVKDTCFHYSDAIQEIFYSNNGPAMWELRKEVRTLNFDHCNHRFQYLIYLDTLGEIKHIQILEESGLRNVDSLVYHRLNSYSKQLIPVNYNGINTCAKIYLQFRYYAKVYEDYLPVKYPVHGSKYFHTNMKFEKVCLNCTYECEDDLFFYNEGLKYYRYAKYSKAIYNFSQALISNPKDLEALFNLGLAYQAADKNIKACGCFSEGIEKGYVNSFKAFDKYCQRSGNDNH